MKLNDDLLRTAAAKADGALERWAETGFDPAAPHAFSPEFERKILALGRRKKAAPVRKLLRTAAAVLLIAALAGASFLAVDVEARKNFLQWVREDELGKYLFLPATPDTADPEPVRFEPTWLPKGYSEYRRPANDDNHGSVLFMDKQQNLLILSYQAGSFGGMGFHGDDMVLESVTVNGLPANYIYRPETGYMSHLVWQTPEGWLFYVNGYISKENMIRFAESIKKITQ